MGRTPSKLLASPTNRFSGTSYSMAASCITLCRGTNKHAPMIAGVVGTGCQVVLLTAMACVHIAAASSATGGLSAVPLNFQGERSDRNAGLQAWGHQAWLRCALQQGTQAVLHKHLELSQA